MSWFTDWDLAWLPWRLPVPKPAPVQPEEVPFLIEVSFGVGSRMNLRLPEAKGREVYARLLIWFENRERKESDVIAFDLPYEDITLSRNTIRSISHPKNPNQTKPSGPV